MEEIQKNNLDDKNLISDFDNLIKNNLIYRFESELKIAFDDERLDQIKKIIKNLKGEKDEEKSVQKIEKETFNAFFEKLSNDVYKKPWHKIPDMNKIVKIKEYIFTLDLDNKGKKLLEKTIIDKLKTGKLEKIDYDNKNCKIIKIKNI